MFNYQNVDLYFHVAESSTVIPFLLPKYYVLCILL